MYPDRVSADGLAKDRPTQVAFSLVGARLQLQRSGPQAGDTKVSGVRLAKRQTQIACWFPQRHGVRCGTLVCLDGYPYCWCEIVKVQSLAAVL